MKRITLSIILLISIINNTFAYQFVAKLLDTKRNSIINTKFNYAKFNHPALLQAEKKLAIKQLARQFPQHKKPEKTHNLQKQKFADLSLIYYFETNVLPNKVIEEMMQTGLFEYVVQLDTDDIQPLYTPNDPLITNQYHLTNIKAYEAWDIEKGDTNVVIGIVDSGTRFDHPDLQQNIKYNWADPINGIDDDGDGYIDNFRGWDIGNNDNDPTASHHHGINVTGMAAASTNDSTGVAGVGFNCKYLPVRIETNGIWSKAFEGVVYAADHGVKVINYSIGAFSTNAYREDVIRYATINKDVLLVAAAGNSNNELPVYPASSKYVLSVASVDINDVKSSSATYNKYVDICAPGNNIYTTAPPPTNYTYTSGSSFAAPTVAAAAALVRSRFPNLNAIQVGELLKQTADDIYNIPANVSYKDKLGTGRLNIYRALTENTKPAILTTNKLFNNNQYTQLLINDTVTLIADFVNYLAPSSGQLQAILSSTDPNVLIIDSLVNLGIMNTLELKTNTSQPLRFKVLPTATENQQISFTITYTDLALNYKSQEYFNVNVFKNYQKQDITTNNIKTTVYSNGLIGNNYVNNATEWGNGITYKDNARIANRSYLMVGHAEDKVDFDFTPVASINPVPNTNGVDFVSTQTFQTNSAYNNDQSLVITQKLFASNEPNYQDFIIVEYFLNNNGTDTLKNIYAGLFTNWDINYFFENSANFDAANRLGYAYNTQNPNTLYGGIKLLSNQNINYYAFGTGDGGLYAADGLNESEMYLSMSNGLNKTVANNSDIANTMAAGPFDIPPAEGVRVAFAFLAQTNLANLQTAAQRSQLFYDNVILGNTNYLLNTVVNKKEFVILSPLTIKNILYINQGTINTRANFTIE